MSTYAIGDIHGCFDPLQHLLDLIKFDPAQDTLWFTGDLCNGGPKPAETMRFIRDLKDNAICILGNHDIGLLAIVAGAIDAPHDRGVGFTPILTAPDRDELLEWMRRLPLTHYDPKFNALLVHAGLLPIWSVAKAQTLAREVEVVLRGTNPNLLYSAFGNYPNEWDEDLQGIDRLRFIANALTRMRFCNAQGALELDTKGESANAPAGYAPWFNFQNPNAANVNVIFGHWSALRGVTGVATAHAIDYGCVWGGSLAALRLDDWRIFSVPAG